MPVAISLEQIGAEPASPRRKTWTRSECALLDTTGIFDGKRYELIEGELIDKMGMNPPHAFVLALVSAWLTRVFGERFVRAQMPINVHPDDNPTSEPQPDVCVIVRPLDQFRHQHPGASDISLIVEVADTSVSFDTGVKAALYARAGIPDYWVFDLPGRRVLVHRSPTNGVYQSITAYSESEPVAPLAAPESSFRWIDAAGA